MKAINRYHLMKSLCLDPPSGHQTVPMFASAYGQTSSENKPAIANLQSDKLNRRITALNDGKPKEHRDVRCTNEHHQLNGYKVRGIPICALFFLLMRPGEADFIVQIFTSFGRSGNKKGFKRRHSVGRIVLICGFSFTIKRTKMCANN